MSDAEPKHKALWRKAIACFWSHRKAWLRVAAIFMLLYFALDIFIYREVFTAPPPEASSASLSPETAQRLASLKAKDPKLAGLLEMGMKDKAPKAGLVSNLFQIGAGLVMAYFFALFFLNHELQRGLTRSGSGFLFYVVETCLAGVLVILSLVVPALTFTVLAQFIAPQNIAIGLGVVLALAIGIYMSIKVSLVGVMAVDGVKTPIRESWALTNNNFWRILGNGLLLAVVMFPLMLASSAALAAIPYVGIGGKLLAMAAHAVLSVVYAGVFMAFACAVYHTLYQERSKAAPAV